MDRDSQAINYTYRIRGAGGQGACIAVQSVLQEYGFCGYTEWNSPDWHFLYLTHLDAAAVLYLLGDLTTHFHIEIENGTNASRVRPRVPGGGR